MRGKEKGSGGLSNSMSNEGYKGNEFVREEAEKFLSLIWFYPTAVNAWYEIRIIGDKAKSYWFRSYEEALEWLDKSWKRLELYMKHVYFGVLPREKFDESELSPKNRKPKRGGAAKHVERGLFIFADIDYKKEIPLSQLSNDIRNKLEEESYYIINKTNDGGLEAYFRKNKTKTVYIRKPGHEEFKNILKSKLDPLGIEPSIIVDSGYGYHVYVKLGYDIEISKWKRLQEQFINLIGGDPKTKDPARIMRLPGTYNPKFLPYTRLVYVVHYDTSKEYDPEELLKKFSEYKPKPITPIMSVKGPRRKLSDQEIEQVANILKNYWIMTHRNNLELGLIGWMWKTGIEYESARKIIERICDLTGDEERKQRLHELDRQWKKFEKGEKSIQEILGKTGVLGELELVIREQNPGIGEEEARDRALAVVSELEKVLGYRKSIIIRTPYETGIWFVNDPRRGIVILRERETEEGIKRYRKYISDWYIRRVYITRGEGQILYKVVFKNARTKEKITFSGDINEIGKELSRIHGIKRSQLIRDAVSAVISEFIKRKIAKVKKTAIVAGILPTNDNGIKLVRNGVLSRLLIPREYDPDKARKALRLLEEIRNHYDHKKFDPVMNWAGYAPLGYALKKLFNVKQIYTLLHGERHTGKTTLARIITGLFPVVTTREEEIPEEGQSEYRLAWKMDITSAPILEDEVQGISRRHGLIGLLKRGSTGDIIRWRGDIGKFYHARGSLVITSNYREVIEDPALYERILSIEFTYTDYVFNKPREKREEFKKLLNEYMSVSPHLGKAILDTLIESWEEIKESWVHRLQEKLDYIEFGKWVWKKVAKKLEADAPKWVEAPTIIEEEKPEEREVTIFWEFMHDVVRESMAKYRHYVMSTNLYDKLKELYEAGALPGYMHVTRDYVKVTPTIINEIEKRYNCKIIGGLKGLAERMGYKYMSIDTGKGKPKGMWIPRYDIVDKLETPEEIAERLKDKYVTEFIHGGRKLEEKEVKKLLIEKEGMSEEKAHTIAPLLLKKINDMLREQEIQEREY